MSGYIPDNYDQFRIRDHEEAEWLKHRPICPICQEPILDDVGYDLDMDGLVCEDCAKDWLEEQKQHIDD